MVKKVARCSAAERQSRYGVGGHFLGIELPLRGILQMLYLSYLLLLVAPAFCEDIFTSAVSVDDIDPCFPCRLRSRRCGG